MRAALALALSTALLGAVPLASANRAARANFSLASQNEDDDAIDGGDDLPDAPLPDGGPQSDAPPDTDLRQAAPPSGDLPDRELPDRGPAPGDDLPDRRLPDQELPSGSDL
jgi:hypothetical protein